MLVHVHFIGLQASSELRQAVRKKVDSALERFHTRIGRVSVFIEDLFGPRNGMEKSCRVIINLEPLSKIVIEDSDRNLATLVGRVAERATHSVRREIDRVPTRSDRTCIAAKQDRPDESDAFVDDEEPEWNPLRWRNDRDE